MYRTKDVLKSEELAKAEIAFILGQALAKIANLEHRLVYLEEENLRRERAEVVAEAVAIEKELQSMEYGTYDYEG